MKIPAPLLVAASAFMVLSLLGNLAMGFYIVVEVPHIKRDRDLYMEKFDHTLNGWNAQMQRLQSDEVQD